MRVSVPGNLLLVGEYAVLEEGGLGVAVAVDRKVVVTSEPSAHLLIEGRFGNESAFWTQGHAASNPLFSAVVDACGARLQRLDTGCWGEPWREGGPRREGEPWREGEPRREGEPGRGSDPGRGDPLPGLRIIADSTAFFSDGRKAGYGSSAAVAVGVAWALLSPALGTGSELVDAVRETALAGHRAMQGGRGSGYDVYTSLYGGFGIFTGGLSPSWRPRGLPWLASLGVFRGSGAVRTPGAVSKYHAWKQGHPEEARRFLSASNDAVRDLASAADWPAGSKAFASLRALGLDLGEAIGVSARMTAIGESTRCKAVGAGNEIGVCIRGPGLQVPDGCELLAVSETGAQCTDPT